MISERACSASCGTPCCGIVRFAFSIIGLIGTLAGTIIGGAAPLATGITGTLATLISLGFTWGAGFACSIIACLLQAVALALTAMVFCSKGAPKQALGQNPYAQTTQSPLSRV